MTDNPHITIQSKYKYWNIFLKIPDGWKIDNTAGSPLGGHVFITNGKSILSGEQERALYKPAYKNSEPQNLLPVVMSVENVELLALRLLNGAAQIGATRSVTNIGDAVNIAMRTKDAEIAALKSEILGMAQEAGKAAKRINKIANKNQRQLAVV